MKFAPVFFLLVASCFGNMPSNLIQQGDYHDQRFEPDSALKFYQAAEQSAPRDATLLVRIARQHVYRIDQRPTDAEKLREAKKALGYAERAVESDPNDADAHLAVAIVLGKMTTLMSNRDAIEASKRIKSSAETAVRLDPRSDYAWHLLGRWHQALAGMSPITRGLARLIYGSLPEATNEQAADCFKKAIALKPGRLIHHIELGRTYAQMGRSEEAREFISRGLLMPSTEKDDPETKVRGRQALARLK